MRSAYWSALLEMPCGNLVTVAIEGGIDLYMPCLDDTLWEKKIEEKSIVLIKESCGMDLEAFHRSAP